jgi:hypothetical protein
MSQASILSKQLETWTDDDVWNEMLEQVVTFYQTASTLFMLAYEKTGPSVFKDEYLSAATSASNNGLLFSRLASPPEV